MKIRENPCYNFLGDLLLEVHGILDPPSYIRCEDFTYSGEERNRLQVTLDNIKIWRKIWEEGLKYDLLFTDNSSDKMFASLYLRLMKEIEFTNSYVVHWNRNPITDMEKQGGEKSGICLPIHFLNGGIGNGLGYKAILHWNIRYTPDTNYFWKQIVSEFIESNLDILIAPSRFGKQGFNSNCMLVKAEFWNKWSKIWDYTPTNKNSELKDIYDSLKYFDLVDGNENQPYKVMDKTKLRLWINPPYEWYRKTSNVQYKETTEGYEVIR